MSFSPQPAAHLPPYVFHVSLTKRIRATKVWIAEYLRVNYKIKATKELLETLSDQSGTRDQNINAHTLARYVEQSCQVPIQKAKQRTECPKVHICVDDEQSPPASPPFTPSAFFSPVTPKTEASTALFEVQSSPSPTSHWDGISSSSSSHFWYPIPSVTPLSESCDSNTSEWNDGNPFSPFLDIRIQFSIHVQESSYSKEHKLEMMVGDSVLDLVTEINALCSHRNHRLFYHLEGKKTEVDDNLYFLPISSPSVPRTLYAQIC